MDPSRVNISAIVERINVFDRFRDLISYIVDICQSQKKAPQGEA